MARFKWRNIPIPEAHIVLLAGGVLLHCWQPEPLCRAPRLRHLFGWTTLLLGIVIAGWAVVAVQDLHIDRPTRVVVTGPYAYSRNPMYVAWTLVYAAITVLVNTWWLLRLLPALLVYTHACVIRREEKQLEASFGEAYRAYRRRVRRYA